MDARSPDRARQSYRHEAFLWHDTAEFAAGLVPFLEDGLEAGEPMMVAVTPEHTGWLRKALGRRSTAVEFVDMHQVGHNPARILPWWQRFLDAHADGVGPVRGVGEPVWPGRRAEELQECQLHEALLNVAVDPSIPFWLICPYDAVQLSPDVVDEAYRSHPVIVEAGAYRGSAQYAGQSHVDSLFGAPLSAPALCARPVHFSARDICRLLTYVKLELHVAGLSADDSARLAAVVQELARSSLHRGSSDGVVRIWRQPHAVVCEVADDGQVIDPLSGRRLPRHEDHDALWLANQVCDLVQLRSTAAGTAVRVHRWT